MQCAGVAGVGVASDETPGAALCRAGPAEGREGLDGDQLAFLAACPGIERLADDGGTAWRWPGFFETLSHPWVATLSGRRGGAN
ncbi:MAG: hypothetical protein OXU20_41890 [Myxococcales bacterium]|nr:hypothetical protein [Myxococcales bacterium]MDD9965109.1 hypothetical protein [Myxococcales bacterium]